MNASPSSGERGSGRRLVVALVVATAAAAVTAGVALNERHPASERPLARADASPAQPDRATTAPATAPRRAPLAETATTVAADPTDAAGAHGDPSLPPAAEALMAAPGSAGEPAPTF